MSFLERNAGIFAAAIGAPITTVISMCVVGAVYDCGQSAKCEFISEGVALFLGILAALVGARIIHRAVTGTSIK